MTAQFLLEPNMQGQNTSTPLSADVIALISQHLTGDTRRILGLLSVTGTRVSAQ